MFLGPRQEMAPASRRVGLRKTFQPVAVGWAPELAGMKAQEGRSLRSEGDVGS